MLYTLVWNLNVEMKYSSSAVAIFPLVHGGGLLHAVNV